MQNLVTVFGGSGFIGAQAVRQLAKAGWRIRVAVRQPNLAYAMRLHGDVGQIDVVQANIRNEASIRRALDGATASLNLVSTLYEHGRQGFQALNVMGARKVARAARAEGATELVGEYVPSPKNKMVEKHYQKLGFTQAGEADGVTTWTLDLNAYEEPDLPVTVVREQGS